MGHSWRNAYSVIEPQITADAVHVWPFDQECPVDVQFLAFEERREVHMNRHDYLEVFYLSSGRLRCQIQDEGVEMRSGDLIILGSTEYHRHTVLAQGPQKPRVAKAAVLYFLPSVFMRSGALVEDAQYLAPFAVHERAASHLIPAATGVPGRVMRTMRQMALHVPAASALDRLALRTLLRVVLLDLVRHYAGKLGEVRSQERKREAIERLRPLYDHVDSNYREAIAVGEAAHVVGMSPARFRRFFKQVTGQSFTAYLASFRVAKAQQLLVRGQASLADIALEVGFCDQSYFGLVFRRIVGMTPRQYQLRFAV